MTEKQQALFLTPLEKIEKTSKKSLEELSVINVAVTGMQTTSLLTHIELQKQTSILGGIQSILEDIRNENKIAVSGKKSKGALGGLTIGSAVQISAFMFISALGIAGASYALSAINPVSPGQLATAILIAIAFIPMTKAFGQLYLLFKPMQESGFKDRILSMIDKNAGALSGGKFSTSDFGKETQSMSTAGALGLTIASMLIMATGITIASNIFQFVNPLSPSKLITAILVGVAMIPAAHAMVGFSKVINEGGLSTDVPGLKKMAMVALAMILITGAIVGMAYALNQLPPSIVEPPEIEWIGKTALMMWVFSSSFSKVMDGIKGKSVAQLAFGIVAMPLLAMAIVGLAYVLNSMPLIKEASFPIGWVISVSIAMYAFTTVFNKVSDAIKGKTKAKILQAGVVMLALAASIVGLAFVFQLLPTAEGDFMAPPLLWTLRTGFALYAFAFGFSKIVNAINGITQKDLIRGAAAVTALAIGIVGIAYVFKLLPTSDGEYLAPDLMWSIKSGIAILMFTFSFVLISKIIAKSGLGVKEMAIAALGVIAIAGAIVAVSWIFSALTEKSMAPEADWSMKTGLAILIFSVPVIVLAAFIAATGGTGALFLLGGIIGIILIATAILAVSKIFGYVDWSVFEKAGNAVTAAMMAPINGMIDALVRVKNELGIENLGSLALGLTELAGGWLALVAALAGTAVGGVLGAGANMVKTIIDGISSLFGGDKSLSPIQLLDEILSRSSGIIAIAEPMRKVGVYFAVIASKSQGVINGLGAWSTFTDDNKSENLQNSAKSAEVLAKAYLKFANASKALNIPGVKASTEMFNSLAKLSDPKVQSAMTILTDKLLKAVQELSTTVVNLQSSVNTQSETTSETGGIFQGLIKNVTDAVDSIKGVGSNSSASTQTVPNNVAPTEPGMGQPNTGEILQLVDAINELVQKFNSPGKSAPYVQLVKDQY
jgi:hypothetical protein